MANKEEIVERLVKQLDAAHEVRTSLKSDAVTATRRERLREWQAERLSRTHADLLTNPRSQATALFFLTDIYGPKDLSQHEEDVRRILPVMTRVLPATGLETVADVFELNALSERLDGAMVRALESAADHLTPADYGRAYRQVGRRADRERQIDLIDQLGHSLDRLTRSSFIGMALSTMRKPALVAGLGGLQDFLERGYKAFRKIGRADEFMESIVTRERQLLEALFAGDDALLS
ncbi:MAG: hypothetical protein WBP94_05160 [Rhodomicrobiaceae bacterium]